jgi:predicted RNA-binding protein (virulence factor B family)
MDTEHPGTTHAEAYRLAETINAYWAQRGKWAGAKVVPVYDHRGSFLSYGIESCLRLAVPPPPLKAVQLGARAP